MTSLDFLNNIINPARAAAGEKPLRNTEMVRKIEDELDLNANDRKSAVGKTGHDTYYFDLTEDQMRLVGMRESKAVRRAVLAELNRRLRDARHTLPARRHVARQHGARIMLDELSNQLLR